MKRTAANSKKRIFFFCLCALLAVLSVVLILTAQFNIRALDSQKAAERWQGDSEQPFAQISCYIPIGSEIDVETVYSYRYAMIKALEDASLEVNGDTALWNDAWSCTGKVYVSGALGKGDAAVTAVGGDFFNFHPIKLISGNYFSAQDVMQDRVLLDRELAWLLYGSSDVEGLSLDINGSSFVVAGVIEREDDSISTRAYKAGRGLYMSYDAYKKLYETAGISCYEFVMAEPVSGYARNTAEASFPVRDAEIVDNTHRFDSFRVMKLSLDPFERSMQSAPIIYPYWENAARYTEDMAGYLYVRSIMLLILPLCTLIYYAVLFLKRGKDKLTDEVIPEAKENISEKIRIRQRRRWERYHGKH